MDSALISGGTIKANKTLCFQTIVFWSGTGVATKEKNPYVPNIGQWELSDTVMGVIKATAQEKKGKPVFHLDLSDL